MGDDFKVLLEAILDTDSIGKSDIVKVQKVLDKYHLNLSADLDKAELLKTVKQIVPELERELSKIAGVEIKISDTALLKTINQITRDAERAAASLKNIQFKIDNGHGISEYQNRIQKLIQDFERYGVSADNARQHTEKLQNIFNQMKSMSGDQLAAQAGKLENEFKAVKVSVEQAKLAYDKFNQPVSDTKAVSLINRINTFLTKNTEITHEARTQLELFIQEINGGVNLNRWNEINGKLKETENSMRGLHRLGTSLKNQLTQAAESFTQWLSVSSAVMLMVSNTREAVTELKNLDSILTEISKANDTLNESDLADIGNSSFETASKYGKKATDYLKGVQEMSRAGYQNAEAMGELSVKAQGAGDMTEDVANKFIVATDKAYKLNGSLTDLTEIMDGINYITNHNAINMTELSEGFSVVGSTAASFGVEADELTAALATMGAATQQSGSEVARAFRAILLNIRQVSDEEEGIDAEGLTKYEKACNALNVKLKETKNGVQELRDPMVVLKELSTEYNKLSDTDVKKVNLLNSVGGKLRSTQLDALLRGWSDYEKMLGQFADGTGSMTEEAEKTANSWEGSMNRLSNTWTDTIGNIANSDGVTRAINSLDWVLDKVNKLTSALGSLGSIGLGAGLFAGIKKVGVA
nr:MAG TPA: minor tail protein [Caudoviricetes sp.]